jgi:hypothetical protein
MAFEAQHAITAEETEQEFHEGYAIGYPQLENYGLERPVHAQSSLNRDRLAKSFG